MSLQDAFRPFKSDTPKFSLDGKREWARVVSVYDGDTIKIILPLFDSYFKFDCRINGIDTCEMKSSLADNKDRACAARNRLIELITRGQHKPGNKATRKDITYIFDENVYLIWVECLDFDKYGRLLIRAALNENEKSLSDILIAEKLAYAYEGKTKLSEQQQNDLLCNM
jgi:endonuclease YncB( thermonuclease family)